MVVYSSYLQAAVPMWSQLPTGPAAMHAMNCLFTVHTCFTLVAHCHHTFSTLFATLFFTLFLTLFATLVTHYPHTLHITLSTHYLLLKVRSKCAQLYH